MPSLMKKYGLKRPDKALTTQVEPRLDDGQPPADDQGPPPAAR
jgi:hypothetical protein